MKKKLLLLASVLVLGSVPVLAENKPLTFDEIVEFRKTTFEKNEEVTLFTGEWVVGEDIKAGRYVITTDEGESGNFFIKESPDGSSRENEILGVSAIGSGVSSITTYLKDGEVIEISGLNNVYFTPKDSELVTELGTGTWVVGLDVKPGKYIATVDEGQSGNFFVRDLNGSTSVNEILGVSGIGTGVEKIKIKVEEGQLIEVSGIEKVYLNQ